MLKLYITPFPLEIAYNKVIYSPLYYQMAYVSYCKKIPQPTN